MFPAVSPDGRWLAYTSTESGRGYEVYVTPFPDTRLAKRVVSTGGGFFPKMVSGWKGTVLPGPGE